MSKKKYGVIRSGERKFAFHEVDVDKKTRVIVQENGHGWYSYIWTDPPHGYPTLLPHNWSSEAEALKWLNTWLED